MNLTSASSLFAMLIIAWPVDRLVEATEEIVGGLDVTG